MKVIRGDLIKLALTGQFDVIVHGCNCFCAMGKGIALTIKQVFPEAYAIDCTTRAGDRDKLGTITTAEVTRGDVALTVVNAYTQFHWRGPDGRADYDAIARAMREVKARFSGERIGYPMLGAGLAGGDWARISGIIDEALAGQDHTCVAYDPGA